MVHTGAIIGMPAADEYVEFAIKLLEAPEEIDKRARRTRDEAKAEIRRWADLGADGFLSTADLADNSGPYFRPEQLERFVYPYLEEWADAARDANGHSIMHTDGDIATMLEAIADCGVSAIQSLDPTAGMDLAKVKKQIGDRIALCGNLDCGLLQTASPETVYEAAKQTLEAGKPGGRYVFGASNVVEAAAPKENFTAMRQAWTDHATY